MDKCANSELFSAWMRSISRNLCKLSCDECHFISGSTTCPDDYQYTEEETFDFIKRVTDKLRDRIEQNDTPLDLSEDDLINILEESI